jgi:hypothetical protein
VSTIEDGFAMPANASYLPTSAIATDQLRQLNRPRPATTLPIIIVIALNAKKGAKDSFNGIIWNCH